VLYIDSFLATAVVVNFTFWPFYPGVRTPMLTEYEAGWREELVATDIRKVVKGGVKECGHKLVLFRFGRVQTGSGVHLASYSVIMVVLYSRFRVAGARSFPHPILVLQSRISGTITPFPLVSS